MRQVSDGDNVVFVEQILSDGDNVIFVEQFYSQSQFPSPHCKTAGVGEVFLTFESVDEILESYHSD